MAAMLAEREGVANSMLRKLGVSPGAIAQEATAALERLAQSDRRGLRSISRRGPNRFWSARLPKPTR